LSSEIKAMNMELLVFEHCLFQPCRQLRAFLTVELAESNLEKVIVIASITKHEKGQEVKEKILWGFFSLFGGTN
jgi:hypothetical protein